jgi:hypothetical protein
LIFKRFKGSLNIHLKSQVFQDLSENKHNTPEEYSFQHIPCDKRKYDLRVCCKSVVIKELKLEKCSGVASLSPL